MRITYSDPRLLREAATQAQAAAKTVGSDPVQGMTGLMKAEKTAALGTQVVKAKDEMLGTIIDLKA